MDEGSRSAKISVEQLKETLKHLCFVFVFAVAFAYIEAAVVVYLHTIFHPDGFTFPLSNFGISPLWRRLLAVEIGREAATIVVILTSAWLFGGNLQRRFAYFLAVFAVWDIFYYVWLKVLINWPASLADWDILFLIPFTWASSVLAPLLVSFLLLAFAVLILYRSCTDCPLKAVPADWLGFVSAALIVVVCFCVAGAKITRPDYQSYFCWPLFALGCVFASALFAKCFFTSGAGRS